MYCSTFPWLHRCQGRAFTTTFGLADSWWQVQGNGRTRGWIWFVIQAGHSGRQDAKQLVLPTGNVFQTPCSMWMHH